MIENHSSTWLSQLAWVGMLQEDVAVLGPVEELLDQGVPWAERLSTMQCSSMPAGVWSTRSCRKATKFAERVESVTQPATVPRAR